MRRVLAQRIQPLQLLLRGVSTRLLVQAAEQGIRSAAVTAIQRLGKTAGLADLDWLILLCEAAASDAETVVRRGGFEFSLRILHRLPDLFEKQRVAQQGGAAAAAAAAASNRKGSGGESEGDIELHLLRCKLVAVIQRLVEDPVASVRHAVAAHCASLCTLLGGAGRLGQQWSTWIVDALHTFLRDADAAVRSAAVDAVPFIAMLLRAFAHDYVYHQHHQAPRPALNNTTEGDTPNGAAATRMEEEEKRNGKKGKKRHGKKKAREITAATEVAAVPWDEVEEKIGECFLSTPFPAPPAVTSTAVTTLTRIAQQLIPALQNLCYNHHNSGGGGNGNGNGSGGGGGGGSGANSAASVAGELAGRHAPNDVRVKVASVVGRLLCQVRQEFLLLGLHEAPSASSSSAFSSSSSASSSSSSSLSSSSSSSSSSSIAAAAASAASASSSISHGKQQQPPSTPGGGGGGGGGGQQQPQQQPSSGPPVSAARVAAAKAVRERVVAELMAPLVLQLLRDPYRPVAATLLADAAGLPHSFAQPDGPQDCGSVRTLEPASSAFAHADELVDELHRRHHHLNHATTTAAASTSSSMPPMNCWLERPPRIFSQQAPSPEQQGGLAGAEQRQQHWTAVNVVPPDMLGELIAALEKNAAEKDWRSRAVSCV